MAQQKQSITNRSVQKNLFLTGMPAFDYWNIPAINGVLASTFKYPKELRYLLVSKKDIYNPLGRELTRTSKTKVLKYTDNRTCTLPLLFLICAQHCSIEE